MIPLTRPHRQAMATMAMVVLTVLPTGYVALTAWRIGRPGHLRGVEAEIGQRLGLQATLDGVRYPRPGEVAGTFQADRAAPTVRVSYRVAARGSNTRCELTLTRDRKTEPVRTTVVMRTMEGLPLPARVLEPFFDAADWLGPAARVDGT